VGRGGRWFGRWGKKKGNDKDAARVSSSSTRDLRKKKKNHLEKGEEGCFGRKKRSVFRKGKLGSVEKKRERALYPS